MWELYHLAFIIFVVVVLGGGLAMYVTASMQHWGPKGLFPLLIFIFAVISVLIIASR